MKNSYIREDETYKFDFNVNNFIKIKNDLANPIRNISDIISNDSKVLDIGCGNGIFNKFNQIFKGIMK